MYTQKFSVGSAVIEHDSMQRIWARSRAVINGELAAKRYDSQLDLYNYTNLLVPFSPKMSPEQYKWYVAESELPGLTSQYAKTLVGGLLRKSPAISLPKTLPDEALNWIKYFFTDDNRSIVSFLDDAVWEELSTSRAWVSVDFPKLDNPETLSTKEKEQIFPYPVLWKAEEVINWQQTRSDSLGRPLLTRVTFRYLDKVYTKDSPFHPVMVPTVADHYIDDSGYYTVDYYTASPVAITEVFLGKAVESYYSLFGAELKWGLDPNRSGIQPKMHGERMSFLPIFPLNGEVELKLPILTPLIDREIALYNKSSRRNHLMYGAATYTPVIMSDMSNENFEEVVAAGLGSWIKLGVNDKVDMLQTPVEALSYMEKSIEAGVNEMARMGIRMLAPEGNDQSGIALEIRNSAQTAQLGVLNTKISETLRRIIYTMLIWKYDVKLTIDEVDFMLSADFNPSPLGADWLKLVTEWYESRLIPRSVFIKVAKDNDILPSDYNDEDGINEIKTDDLPNLALAETIKIQEG